MELKDIFSLIDSPLPLDSLLRNLNDLLRLEARSAHPEENMADLLKNIDYVLTQKLRLINTLIQKGTDAIEAFNRGDTEIFELLHSNILHNFDLLFENVSKEKREGRLLLKFFLGDIVLIQKLKNALARSDTPPSVRAELERYQYIGSRKIGNFYYDITIFTSIQMLDGLLTDEKKAVERTKKENQHEKVPYKQIENIVRVSRQLSVSIPDQQEVSGRLHKALEQKTAIVREMQKQIEIRKREIKYIEGLILPALDITEAAIRDYEDVEQKRPLKGGKKIPAIELNARLCDISTALNTLYPNLQPVAIIDVLNRGRTYLNQKRYKTLLPGGERLPIIPPVNPFKDADWLNFINEKISIIAGIFNTLSKIDIQKFKVKREALFDFYKKNVDPAFNENPYFLTVKQILAFIVFIIINYKLLKETETYSLESLKSQRRNVSYFTIFSSDVLFSRRANIPQLVKELPNFKMIAA